MYGEHLWSTIRFSSSSIVASGIQFCGQKRLTARDNVREPGLIWETGGLSDKSAHIKGISLWLPSLSYTQTHTHNKTKM